MNASSKALFTAKAKLHGVPAFQANLRTPPPVLTEAEKEANYTYLRARLKEWVGSTAGTETDVKEAAAIVKALLPNKPEVSVKKVAEIDVKKLLEELQNDRSTVHAVLNGVNVALDIDQLKHQPSIYKIGSRLKGGGNKFKDSVASEAWHTANTMQHMADWANALAGLKEGEKVYHGQANAVNLIHYEGYCELLNGTKYVNFHCYPANDSPLKW